MEKGIEDFNYGLFFWQVFLFALILTIIFFIFKFYKGIMNNLD